MALVNPNIAMSYRGIEIPQQNALADYAAVQQIQGGRQTQELNALKMQEAQRTAKSQNVLADAYAQATDETGKIDYNKLTRLVAAGGGGAQLPGIQKLRTEQSAAETKLQKDQADLLDAKLKQSRSFLDTIDLANPNAPAQYLAWHEANHKDPIIGAALAARGVSADQARQSIEAAIAKGPAAFANLVKQSMLGTEKFMEMNKPIAVSPGASVFQGGQSVFTAPATPAAPPSMVAEYNFAKTTDGGRFKGSFQDFVTARAAAGRAPAAPRVEPAPTVTTVEDPNNPGKFLQVDARQYKGGGAGSPGVIGGARPSALSEKTATQKVQLSKDINQAIFELKDAAKTGGLIDKSTGSGAGRLYDIGAGFFGSAPEGAIATGQLAPIADLVLKMVPRFEGPQSDKDTQSYKAAAGQLADSSLPTKIRKAAANEIIRLMEARKNQFGSADMAPSGVAPPAGFTPD